MRPDQNDHGRSSSSFDDDPLLQALAGLDPATSDSAPVVGSDRHLTILEHAMSTPTGNTDPGGARITPLQGGSDHDPDATDLDAQATYPAAPASNGRRRGPGRLAVGVAAILATFAGGFAFNTLTQPDGATTPEAAVQGLFDAIDDEDLIGVVESLDPAERRIVRPALERLSDELERTGVVSDDLDLGGVDGIDITVDGLDVRASYLGDDVATVQVVGGTIQADGNLADLPVGRVLDDLIERERESNGEDWLSVEAHEPADLSGIELVARRVDGSWHVSLLYTAAELIRTDMNPQPDPPSYGKGIAPKGAESPEAAVRELVDAGIAVDTRRMIELMPPGEGDVFHDYGPILIEELADTDPADIEVEALDLEVVERSGNTAQVGATRLHVRNTSGGDDFSVVYDGDCTVTTFTYQWYGEFGYEDESGTYHEGPDPASEGSETETYDSCDPENVAGSLPLLPFVFDLDGVTVTTVEHDGLWYVSPAATILDALLDTFSAYDADQFERDLRAFERPWLSYADEFWDACGVDQPAEDADLDSGYQALYDCWDALPGDYSGRYNTVSAGPLGLFGIFAIGYSSSESFSAEGEAIGPMEWPSGECYQLDQGTPDSRDEVISCLEGLAAAGEIDPSEVQSFRCSSVFDDLYYESRENDLTEAEFEAADRAWEACMADHAPPPGSGVLRIPGDSDGPDGDTSTQTTVVDPMPEEWQSPVEESTPATVLPGN